MNGSTRIQCYSLNISNQRKGSEDLNDAVRQYEEELLKIIPVGELLVPALVVIEVVQRRRGV